MTQTVLMLLLGLQLKHYAADYLLQPRWMIAGKVSLLAPGGYVHAGIHALLSVPVLALAGPGWLPLLLIAIAEFAVHYTLDYAKVQYSGATTAHDNPGRFWALHGFDQLLHQLTYAAMIYVAIMAAHAS